MVMVSTAIAMPKDIRIVNRVWYTNDPYPKECGVVRPVRISRASKKQKLILIWTGVPFLKILPTGKDKTC